MIFYQFSVAGLPAFCCEAESPLKAYGLANAHYEKLVAGSLPQGAWMESLNPSNAYYWTKGNFFD